MFQKKTITQGDFFFLLLFFFFLERSLQFTKDWKGRHSDSLFSPCFDICTFSSTVHIPYQSGMFVTTDESTLTHDIMITPNLWFTLSFTTAFVHSAEFCTHLNKCIMASIIIIHAEQFNCPKNPVFLLFVLPPSSQLLATTGLFIVPIVQRFPECRGWNHTIQALQIGFFHLAMRI